MKLRFVPLLALAVLVAAACSPAATTTPTTQAPAASTESTPTPETLQDGPAGGDAAASSANGLGGIAQQPVATCADVTDPNITMPENSNQQQFSAPEQVVENSHIYCAIVTTEQGKFIIQLNPINAPQNVNNFVFLASKGFYDNIGFHRVITGFMAQSGDPTGTGAGGPGYNNIPLEATGPMKYDKPGVIGVARTTQPNSAGSQFFITFGPADFLNNAYTIIGEVVEGMDVVNKIKVRDVDSDPNADSIIPERLISVRIVDIGAK